MEVYDLLIALPVMKLSSSSDSHPSSSSAVYPLSKGGLLS